MGAVSIIFVSSLKTNFFLFFFPAGKLYWLHQGVHGSQQTRGLLQEYISAREGCASRGCKTFYFCKLIFFLFFLSIGKWGEFCLPWSPGGAWVTANNRSTTGIYIGKRRMWMQRVYEGNKLLFIWIVLYAVLQMLLPVLTLIMPKD